MEFVDLPESSRRSALSELTRAFPGCKTPFEALLMYCRYLRDGFPDRALMVLSTSGLPAGQYRVWRLMQDDGNEQVELHDPWQNMDLPIYSGGVIAGMIEAGSPRLVRDIDWRDDPNFSQSLKPYRSAIVVPLISEGFPLNWSVMLSREESRFTPAQLEESVIRGTLIASLLANMQVSRELATANAYIQAELHRMARIQRALLPKPIPDIPGICLAASYATFGQVGGDLYDFIPINDDASRWCIFLGDASGHGPSAAVVAAMVQTTLHDCAANSSRPSELFMTLNRRLCNKRIEGSFVTAFIGFFEPATRRLCYSLAGHPPPVVVSFADQAPRFLKTIGGLPLGIDDDCRFDEMTIELLRGDSLLLYTDGISEARSPAGLMFGDEGIVRSLSRYSDDAQGVINQLQASLDAHQKGQRPDDDQTSVVIHVDR
jgi:phosphoserine phosphatase RsbU/P